MRRLALLLALAAPTAVLAQPTHHAPAGAALNERMTPFAWLVGEWHGSGWFITPDGTRHTVESREVVTPKLSGTALLVEGRHHAAGQPDRVVHDAMAMLTWDRIANAYRFRSALASHVSGDYAIQPTANGFTWSMDTPGGRIVYTTTHDNGVWTERGSRTGADGRSVDFFEMTLRKR